MSYSDCYPDDLISLKNRTRVQNKTELNVILSAFLEGIVIIYMI